MIIGVPKEIKNNENRVGWKNRKAEKVSFWEVYQVLNQLKY